MQCILQEHTEQSCQLEAVYDSMRFWCRCFCKFAVYDSPVCYLQFTGAWHGTSADDPYGIWGQRPGPVYLPGTMTVYIVLFVMGGVQNWLTVLNGRKTGQIIVYGFVAALLFTGYQVRRRVMKNVCRVEVWLSGKSRILWAYCDSGNLLRDPDSGAPVSVLEQELFEQLPQDTVRKKEISYRTIRQEGSMMVVLLDRMDIWQKGTKSRFSNRKSGLQKGPVMQHPRVQMLLQCLPILPDR